MSKVQRFPDYDHVDSNIRVHISMKRINRNLDRAQMWLDRQIMIDMTPLMPIQTGSLRQRTQAVSEVIAGTGRVYAGVAPYGRFQYHGKVMVDPGTGSPWARKGVKKELTNRALTYSNPQARAEWFEVAKKRNLKQWVNGVKKIMGE